MTSGGVTAEAAAFDDAKARRNAMILAASQAIFGATSTALVVTAGLVGSQIARILVERYGASAHPLRMIKLTTDEVSHLVEVALRSDTVVLAVRAACPALKPLRIQPALQAHGKGKVLAHALVVAAFAFHGFA